ncbi:MAG: hypothetical protein WBF06_15950 [Candidatus Acidiferrales bacterium]
MCVSCQVAGCRRDVLPSLATQGLCLGHYLEMAFVRVEAALEICQTGGPVVPGSFDWLLLQGDVAAETLAKGGGAPDPIERTRLLELLLCLANLHEYVAHHTIEARRSARPGGFAE